MATNIQVGNYEKPRLVVTKVDEQGKKLDVKILPISSKVAEALIAAGTPTEG